MHELQYTNQDNDKADQRYEAELDAGLKYVSRAVKSTFIMLKVIMVVLIVVFLVSGFKTVGSDEQALVLRFGKIRGVGEERLLGPGLHWVFPYPIDEIVRIPVAKKVNLPINSFWYYQSKEEQLEQDPKAIARHRMPNKLDPIRDGYCITRGEKQIEGVGGGESDYNIVHCKWLLIYKIDDAERFFRNVYVDGIRPGESYADVIEKSVSELLGDLVADSVVTAMVDYSIDEAISSKHTIPEHVKELVQGKLDRIESGITAVSVQLAQSVWPRQVDLSFQASITASQASQTLRSAARSYAENTLIETEGLVQEKLAEARAYRTSVVQTAKANAEYLQKILPEYRKRPELVVQRIYLDAIETVLNSADEKMVIQPTRSSKGNEIRLQLNRDPKLKKAKVEDGK